MNHAQGLTFFFFKDIEITFGMIKEAVTKSQHKNTVSFFRFLEALQQKSIEIGKNPYTENLVLPIFNKQHTDAKKAKEEIVGACNSTMVCLRQDEEKKSDFCAQKLKKCACVVVSGFIPELAVALQSMPQGSAPKVIVVGSLWGDAGKKWAQTLRKSNVSFSFYPVVAARQALKTADAVFLNAVAMTSEKTVTTM